MIAYIIGIATAVNIKNTNRFDSPNSADNTCAYDIIIAAHSIRCIAPVSINAVAYTSLFSGHRALL